MTVSAGPGWYRRPSWEPPDPDELNAWHAAAAQRRDVFRTLRRDAALLILAIAAVALVAVIVTAAAA